MGDSPSQTATSTPTLDPDIKARLLGNLDTANVLTSGILPTWKANGATGAAGTPSYGSYTGGTYVNGVGYVPAGGTDGQYVNADGTPYKPPTSLTAGFTNDQLGSFNKIRALPSAGLTTPEALGRGTFDDLANFKARDASYTGVTAPTMQAGQVGQVADVTSKDFTDYDLSKYMNPALANTVDPVKAYFNTQSDRAAAAAQGAARAAGALRGSSPAIGTALARGEIAQQAGLALSPLYQHAYDTATGLITGDANRDLTASQGNQATQLTRATTQAGLDQSANAANAQAQLQAGLANADNWLKTSVANQSADAVGAGVRATGATGYANANKGASDALIQNASLLGSIGDQQQAQNQAAIDDPFKALQIRSGLVNAAIPGSTGQTSTTSGGGPGIAGTLGGLGTAALGLSKLIPLL